MALQIRTFYKKKDRFLENLRENQNQNFCFVHERTFVQQSVSSEFYGTNISSYTTNTCEKTFCKSDLQSKISHVLVVQLEAFSP